MELAYLHNILDDLRSRFEAKHSRNDFQLKRELHVLGRFEKLLIRKKVLEFNYSVGALKVLKILKETGILMFTDYLSSISDVPVAQGVITDVIDSKDSQDFFVDIITSSTSSQIIKDHFEECFRHYTSDVVERPELIKHELFVFVEKKVPYEVFRDSIVLKFVNELLAQESPNASDLSTILSNQNKWNASFTEDNRKLLIQILQDLSVNHSVEIAKQLISSIKKGQKINWYFLLLIVTELKKTSEVVEEIKNFLNRLFQKFHDTSAIDNIFIMMILGRQFHFYSENCAAYKNWLKLTIGEMHYKLKSQSKFQQTIAALQSLIFVESDIEILDIHVQTAISAPRGMNHLVLEYKQQLRIRIASQVAPESCMDLT